MGNPSRTSLSDALMPTLAVEGLMGDMDPMFVENAESNTGGMIELTVVLPVEPQRFDFGDVSAEALAEIDSLRHAIVVKSTAAIIGVGEALLRLKELIEQHCVRGTWMRFVETGLPFSESSARNYLRAAKAAKRFGDGATVAGKMSPTAVYEAHDAPVAVVKEIERRVGEGGTITGQDVRDMKLALRQNKPVGNAVNSSIDAETDDIRPQGIGQSTEGHSFAPPRLTLTHSPKDTRSSLAAATELVARLRDHFEDDKIAELDELWHTVGPGAVRSLLSL